jgi:hypothetical protein
MGREFEVKDGAVRSGTGAFLFCFARAMSSERDVSESGEEAEIEQGGDRELLSVQLCVKAEVSIVK